MPPDVDVERARSSRETASTRVSTMKSRVTARVSRVVSSPPRAQGVATFALVRATGVAPVSPWTSADGDALGRARGRWGRRCDAS